MDHIKRLERIRRIEDELSFADPKKAAKLTRLLVRLKAAVFKDGQ